MSAAGALHDRCLLVHAVNLEEDEVELIADTRSSVVWCPSSNLFLFGKTTPIGRLIDVEANILLGTDSPCSGSGSLREELQVALGYLCASEGYSIEDAAGAVLRMVTVNAASGFRSEYPGGISEGMPADLLLTDWPGGRRGLGGWISSRWRPQMLTIGGRYLLAPRSWAANGYVVPQVAQTEAFGEEEEYVVVGSPRELLRRVSEAGGKEVSGFPLFWDLADGADEVPEPIFV